MIKFISIICPTVLTIIVKRKLFQWKISQSSFYVWFLITDHILIFCNLPRKVSWFSLNIKIILLYKSQCRWRFMFSSLTFYIYLFFCKIIFDRVKTAVAIWIKKKLNGQTCVGNSITVFPILLLKNLYSKQKSLKFWCKELRKILWF